MARALSVLLVLVLLAPAAGAWRVEPPAATAPTFSPAVERWALAFGHASLEKTKAKHATRHVAVCALGDVDRDGHPDILFRVKMGASKLAFKALAGPDFKRVLWARSSAHGATLRCAGDVDRDGRKDPIVHDPPQPTSPLPVPTLPIPPIVPVEVDLEDDDSLIDAVDGASGAPLAEVHATDSSRDITVAGSTAGTTSVADLSPAAPGVLVHVDTTTDAGGLTLPLAGQGATSTEPNVTITLLDPHGDVTGEIQPSSPAETIVAYAGASTPATPEVIVMSTRDASPLDGAPAQTTTTSAYTPSGALVWSTTSPPTTDTPVLVPDAGDVNGDGVNDTIIEHVPSDVDARPSPSVEVVSGADGSPILTKGADQGSVMALPLGPSATASAPADAAQAETPASASPNDILVIAQPAPDAPITLSCTTSGGATCWSAQVPASATPVNAATDPTTGDITGFHDLTGDGTPDVAVVSATGSQSTLQVIDGATGKLAWSAPVPSGSNVTALPNAKGGADLLVTGPATSGLGASAIDGATGATLWSATGGSGQHVTDVTTTDVNGDGTDDVLVTTEDGGGAGGPSGPSQPLEPTATTRIIDGKTGGPIWTGTTDPTNATAPPFESTTAPGATAKPSFVNAAVISIIALLALALVILLFVVLRRRRRQDAR